MQRASWQLAIISLLLVGCDGAAIDAKNIITSISSPTSSQACEQLGMVDYRNLTDSFEPPPGHSYPVTDRILAAACKQDTITKGDRTIIRYLYQVDTGLEFYLLVENSRVIGYDFPYGNQP